jgi:PPM family protein phosphatase
MNLDVASLTDIGRRREINEDGLYVQVLNASGQAPLGLLVVCDGMGGHLGGELASQWAIEAVKKELGDCFCRNDQRATIRLDESAVLAAVTGQTTTQPLAASQSAQAVLKAVERANEVVWNFTRQKIAEAGDAGTTLVLAWIQGRQVIIANVGDSRAYVMRAGKFTQITNDHSVVWGLVRSGQLREEEIYTHPQRSVIYRSIGQKETVSVDLYTEELNDGDILMLCSDGLWEMVHDKEWMSKVVQSSRSLNDACVLLIEAANQGGGDDNISVILARVQE